MDWTKTEQMRLTRALNRIETVLEARMPCGKRGTPEGDACANLVIAARCIKVALGRL